MLILCAEFIIQPNLSMDDEVLRTTSSCALDLYKKMRSMRFSLIHLEYTHGKWYNGMEKKKISYLHYTINQIVVISEVYKRTYVNVEFLCAECSHELHLQNGQFLQWCHCYNMRCLILSFQCTYNPKVLCVIWGVHHSNFESRLKAREWIGCWRDNTFLYGWYNINGKSFKSLKRHVFRAFFLLRWSRFQFIFT